MVATPREWHYTSAYPFEAKYRGQCAGCDELFEPGDLIEWREGQLVKSHICQVSSTLDDEERVHIRVMPRNRTAADRCGQCFQIPSSNGTCGCL